MQMNLTYLLGPALGLVLLPFKVVVVALPLPRAAWNTTTLAAGGVFAAYQMGHLWRMDASWTLEGGVGCV